MHLLTRISRAVRGLNAARLTRQPHVQLSSAQDSEDETPLMVEVDAEKAPGSAARTTRKSTPLPFKQLLVIVVVRITEPVLSPFVRAQGASHGFQICYSLIFPFVNDVRPAKLACAAVSQPARR